MKTTHRTFASIFTFCTVAALGAACARPVQVKTAPGFIELREQSEAGYVYRATSPDGVVIGVRAIEDEERGDLAFWVRSITLQLRDVRGYALLDTSDTKTSDGVPGKRLRFGSDEGKKTYLYEVTLFRTKNRLFVVEAGGLKEQVERARASLDCMHATLKVH